MKFMLLHYVAADLDHPSESDVALEAWQAESIVSKANLGGARLEPARNSATVRTRDGEILITDGPFAETKEQIAGYDIIDCANLSEAVQIAAMHPTVRFYGTIEVRPFLGSQ